MAVSLFADLFLLFFRLRIGEIDVWLDYALFETALGNHQAAQLVVYRAEKTLASAASFIGRYQALRAV